jgi:hypothetical protein
MKNDMKLIMESWKNSSIMLENDSLDPVGEELGSHLEDAFEKAAEELKKELESKLNEEPLSIGAILVGFWIKSMTYAGTTAALAKFAKYLVGKSQGANRTGHYYGLESLEKFTANILTNIATVGIRFILEPLIKRISSDPDRDLKTLDTVLKIAAIVIALAVAGKGAWDFAEKSGGIKSLVSSLFKNVGTNSIIDVVKIQRNVETSFANSIEAMDVTFEASKFINDVTPRIGANLRLVRQRLTP